MSSVSPQKVNISHTVSDVVINFYSFPNEWKPRIAKIQMKENIFFVIFTVYLIQKFLYFIGKHIRTYVFIKEQ